MLVGCRRYLLLLAGEKREGISTSPHVGNREASVRDKRCVRRGAVHHEIAYIHEREIARAPRGSLGSFTVSYPFELSRVGNVSGKVGRVRECEEGSRERENERASKAL